MKNLKMSEGKAFNNLLQNINKLYPKELVRETEKVIMAYRQLLEDKNVPQPVKSEDSSKSFETKNKLIKMIKEKLALRNQEIEDQKQRYDGEITNLRCIIQLDRQSYREEISALESKVSELDSQISQSQSEFESLVLSLISYG